MRLASLEQYDALGSEFESLTQPPKGSHRRESDKHSLHPISPAFDEDQRPNVPENQLLEEAQDACESLRVRALLACQKDVQKYNTLFYVQHIIFF